MILGTLKSARRVLKNALSSCVLAALLRTTTASTSSPYFGSGTPKAAASADLKVGQQHIVGSRWVRFSRRRGLIISLIRPREG